MYSILCSLWCMATAPFPNGECNESPTPAKKDSVEMPTFCNSDHIGYLDRLLEAVGPDRAIWIENLLKHYPDLTAEQADDIVYYYLAMYMDSHSDDSPITWSHRYLRCRISLRGL
jgi:hypothetical protein